MSTRVYELTNLGIRVFYSPKIGPGPVRRAQTKDAFLANCKHKHSCYELHIVEEGSMVMHAGGAAHTVNARELCLIRPGTAHASDAGVSEVRRFCVSFELLPDQAVLSEHIARLPFRSGLFIGDSGKLLPAVHQLQNLQYSDPFLADELVTSLLSQLLVQLVRSSAEIVSEAARPNSNLSDIRTFHIDDFFNNRFYCSDSEDALAEELGVSRRQLGRIVQSIYAKSFREKLQEVRLEAACELLLGNLPIREIAERLGYSTCSNFTVFFKRTTGVTPSQYRRKNKL